MLKASARVLRANVDEPIHVPACALSAQLHLQAHSSVIKIILWPKKELCSKRSTLTD